MIIIRYIVLYFIIIFGAIFFADKLKKNLQNTISINLMMLIVIIYIFGIFKLLNISFYIASIMSILLGCATIIKNIKNKTIKELNKKIFNPGTLFFTLLFLIFIITTIKRTSTHWDQYSYWSYAAKDMYYSENLYILNSINIQYPPMPTILQVLFMKIIGKYSQGIEIFAIWILSFSLLIPLFNKSNGKKICNIAIGIIVLCIPAIFNMVIFYESSYPDALLGLFIGYMFAMYFFEKNQKLKDISIFLSTIVVTLTKPSGFVIATLIIFSFLIFECIKNKLKLKEFLKCRQIKIILIYILIIILTYLSFNLYFNLNKNKQNYIIKINTQIEKTTGEKINTLVNSIFTTTLGIYQENYNEARSVGNLLSKMQKTIEIYNPIEISALRNNLYIYIYIFINI